MCHDVAGQLNRARPDVRFVPGRGFNVMTWGSASPWKKVPPKTPAETTEWIERVMAMG